MLLLCFSSTARLMCRFFLSSVTFRPNAPGKKKGNWRNMINEKRWCEHIVPIGPTLLPYFQRKRWRLYFKCLIMLTILNSVMNDGISKLNCADLLYGTSYLCWYLTIVIHLTLLLTDSIRVMYTDFVFCVLELEKWMKILIILGIKRCCLSLTMKL